MTALLVGLLFAGVWLAIVGAHELGQLLRRHGYRSSWLGEHERNVRAGQLERERRESARIGWRR